MGVSDPEEWEKVYAQSKLIAEQGYVCVNAKGEMQPPLSDGHLPRDELIKMFRDKLYSGATKENDNGK